MYHYIETETYFGLQMTPTIKVISREKLPVYEPGYKNPDSGIWVNARERKRLFSFPDATGIINLPEEPIFRDKEAI